MSFWQQSSLRRSRRELGIWSSTLDQQWCTSVCLCTPSDGLQTPCLATDKAMRPAEPDMRTQLSLKHLPDWLL